MWFRGDVDCSADYAAMVVFPKMILSGKRVVVVRDAGDAPEGASVCDLPLLLLAGFSSADILTTTLALALSAVESRRVGDGY